MNFETIEFYLENYGLLALFIVVLLEYMNLPGFPAGIIMPLAGIWAYKFNKSFLLVIVISVIAGLIGSWILYFLGFYIGRPLLNWFRNKFTKQSVALDKAIEQLNQKGYWGLLIAKLFPVIRTIISIPAGVIKMNFYKYSFYSTIGIIIWNLVFVGGGYIFGSAALNWFAKF
ncbi:DedA family protein [Miniphocaeibacter halophilus]|uniref:DedA family protein n=1 Tax=Miniphocaeibacter halophilus TaxID=2931922 RepID=A0AC61MMI8_9FIRM|nr:DedA family protein [Miniphocaeibacter halophilus]QQK06920.1 DedA family protein [Miniphocaeibacter halophilus]